ncbi:hypothetical protein [Bacillus sp. FSL M8-0168]|uniref:hypothetical protein n=1 Tax=Bacillus sp. FSL M8-0168 TaxID=2921614 RepID=UPI0030FD4F0E
MSILIDVEKRIYKSISVDDKELVYYAHDPYFNISNVKGKNYAYHYFPKIMFSNHHTSYEQELIICLLDCLINALGALRPADVLKFLNDNAFQRQIMMSDNFYSQFFNKERVYDLLRMKIW